MTSSTAARRLAALEAAHAAATRRKCGKCWGTGSLLVHVPLDAAEDDPAYTPTHCPGGGMALRRLVRIIGMSEDEMFPPQEGQG